MAMELWTRQGQLLSLVSRQAEPEAPFIGDPNEGVSGKKTKIIASCIFMIVLAVSATGARVGFRKSMKLPLKWDDHFSILGCLIAVANSACYLACLKFGFGERMMTVPPEDLLQFFKLVWATFHLYGGAITMVKFSILFFYYRIFPRSFNKSLLALGVITIVWWVSFTFLTTFQCLPVQKNWDASIPGVCLNYLWIYIGIQIWNIALDTAILVLPMRAVYRLQLTTAKKIGVGGTFALGGISIIFAIIRLIILVLDRNQTDITFDIETAIWSLIEPAFQIFCASLPCLTPILKAGQYLSEWSSRQFSSSAASSKRKIKLTSEGSASLSGPSSSQEGFTAPQSSRDIVRKQTVSITSERAAMRPGEYV